jgi:hypothetical protein
MEDSKMIFFKASVFEIGMETKKDMTWTGSVCCEVLLFFTSSTDRQLDL